MTFKQLAKDIWPSPAKPRFSLDDVLPIGLMIIFIIPVTVGVGYWAWKERKK